MKNPRKVAAVIEGLSGSWELPLLAALDEEPLRSAELRRRMSRRLDYRVFGDTATSLTDRGLISRIEHGPESVSYELTVHGRLILGMLEGLETWIEGHPQTAARVPRTSPGSEGPADTGEGAGIDEGVQSDLR